MENERSREIVKYCSDESGQKRIYALHTLLRNTLCNSTNAALYVKGKLRLLFINKTARYAWDCGRAAFPDRSAPQPQTDYLMGAAERLATELDGTRRQGIFLTLYKTIEGKKIPIEISYSFIEHGGEKAGLCFIRNVDERLRLEGAQVDLEGAFHTIAENSVDYVCRHDAEGRVVYSNVPAEKAIGLSAGSIAGMTLAEIMPGTESEKYMEALRRSVKDDASGFVKMEFPGHNRGRRHYVVRFFPEHDPGGEIAGVMAIGRDLTEHPLQEEELLKADKLESLSVFAGCIAHDFNNLLNVVMWSIARLANSGENISSRHVDDATEACQEAMELSRRLMSFAKGAGAIRKPVLIGPLLRDSISMHGKHVHVDLDLASDLHVVEADESQLRQMFGNLAINAAEAMPDGGTLHVKAENVTTDKQSCPELSSGSYVRVSFSDEGCGIDESVLPKIFEPYFTTKPKGTGLGLASCYLIVSNHGGKISVASTVGVGSVFTVCLPACSSPAN